MWVLPKTQQTSETETVGEREMLRSIVRGAAARGSPPWWRLSPTANYAKTPRGTKKEIKRTKSKGKDADVDAVPASDIDAALFEEGARARRLALDENDPSLDVGPNGRPLFTFTPSLSQLTRADTGKYFKFKLGKTLASSIAYAM